MADTYHGRLCKNGHTLRWRSDYSCVECRREYTREYMERQREDHIYRYSEQLLSRRRKALKAKEKRGAL